MQLLLELVEVGRVARSAELIDEDRWGCEAQDQSGAVALHHGACGVPVGASIETKRRHALGRAGPAHDELSPELVQDGTLL